MEEDQTSKNILYLATLIAIFVFLFGTWLALNVAYNAKHALISTSMNKGEIRVVVEKPPVEPVKVTGNVVLAIEEPKEEG